MQLPTHILQHLPPPFMGEDRGGGQRAPTEEGDSEHLPSTHRVLETPRQIETYSPKNQYPLFTNAASCASSEGSSSASPKSSSVST